MTNAEKFLKDGVTAEEFVKAVWSSCYNIQEAEEDRNYKNCCMYGTNVERWLNERATPTPTDDERAILRNIDTSEYSKIGIYDDTIMLFSEDGDHEEIYYFKKGLFQFIKERRRI